MKTLLAILLLASSAAFADQFDWDVNKSVHENVLAMQDELQMFTLAFLVNESGYSCEPVLHTYQGRTGPGNHFWMVGCSNGTDWSVMLADDGYQVISCAEWEQYSERSCLDAF